MSNNHFLGAIYGTLLFIAHAGHTQPQESNVDADTLLEASYDAESFSWEPLLNGVSRFDFKIPTAAFKNAQRYGDTNALYYMSEISNDGFRIRSKEKITFELSYDPGSTHLQLSYPYSSSISLYARSGFNSVENNHYFGASYRLSNADGKGLSYTTISTDLSTFRLAFDRFMLSENDTIETFYGTGLTSENQLSGDISVGRRWFNFFGSQDMLIQGKLEKNLSTLFTGLGLNYQRAELNYGLQFEKAQNRSTTEFVVKASISFNDKKHMKMVITTSQFPAQNRFITPNTVNLRDFRRSNLHEIWRDKFTY